MLEEGSWHEESNSPCITSEEEISGDEGLTPSLSINSEQPFYISVVSTTGDLSSNREGSNDKPNQDLSKPAKRPKQKNESLAKKYMKPQKSPPPMPRVRGFSQNDLEESFQSVVIDDVKAAAREKIRENMLKKEKWDSRLDTNTKIKKKKKKIKR